MRNAKLYRRAVVRLKILYVRLNLISILFDVRLNLI